VLQPLQPETFLSAELPAATSALLPENSRLTTKPDGSFSRVILILIFS
jgi:hypothetical protein